MGTHTRCQMSKQKNEEGQVLVTGDILEDRNGNKMVILDVLKSRAVEGIGHEVFVLLNGRVKRISTTSPYIIKSYKKSTHC